MAIQLDINFPAFRNNKEKCLFSQATFIVKAILTSLEKKSFQNLTKKEEPKFSS